MSELVGKTVLVGVTCLDRSGDEIDSFQVYGDIERSDENWIGIKRAGLSELFGLPPAPELLERAPAGIYTLHSTGEQVDTPDYVATLKVTVSDPESLLTLRGVGFEPASA